MFESNRRWVYFYDFYLKSIPKEAPDFKIADVIKNLTNLTNQNKAIHQYRHKEVTMRIREMKVTKERAEILIHLSDIKATDPAFSNNVTGNVRTEKKQPNEGIAVACHVIIKLAPVDPKQNRFLAVIEEVKGIPRSQIEAFLTALMKLSCSREFIKSDNDDKPKPCRPSVKLAAHGGKNLKDILTTGELKGITLIKDNSGVHFDDKKELEIAEESIKLKNLGAKIGRGAIELINSVREKAKKDKFDQVKVVYSEVIDTKVKKLANGKVSKKNTTKQRTMNFNPRKANLADDLFTRSEPVKLDKEIGQCDEMLHSELVNKMYKLLNENSG